MELSEYQRLALQTADIPEGYKITYPTIEINGEAGEIAEKVKKVLRDKGGVFSSEDCVAIAYEIGDVLWGLAALSRDIGYSLDAVARMNIEKLKGRKQRGTLTGEGDYR